MIPFPFNENRFSFFVVDHLLVDQLCTNPKSDRSRLSCLKVAQCSTSEIGICVAVQLMLSTNPSYDNRLESQHQSVPGCAEECGDLLVQSGGRWQTLGVAAGLSVGPQVQREPGLASEGVLWLCTLLSLAPFLPQPEPTGLLPLVIRWEHHQHDLPQHQSQPNRRHPPSFRRHLWERHTPSSGSVSRRWLRLKTTTLNRCQLYYIIKLPELIFFNKSFKIKL